MSQQHPADRQAAAAAGTPSPGLTPIPGAGEDGGEDRREELAVAALTLVYRRIGEAVLTVLTSSLETAHERALAVFFACLVHAEPVLQAELPDVWRICRTAAGAVRADTDGGNDLTVLRSELLAIQRALHRYLIDHGVSPEDLTVLDTGRLQRELLTPLADRGRLAGLMPAAGHQARKEERR